MTRRTLLAVSALAATAAAVGCGRQRASRYFGRLFIASAAENALAVADLSVFRRIGSIPLPQAPAQVLRVGQKVFATCPDGHTVFEIDPDSFRIAGKVTFPGRIAGAAVFPNGTRIAVLIDQPAALHLLDPSTRHFTARIALPGAPALLDVTNDLAAVSMRGSTSVLRVSLQTGKLAGQTELGFHPGVVRLHDDAKMILVGASDRNEIVTVDSVSGLLLARLPMAFTPARFCFNVDNGHDGGQMFVTGSAGDELAIVSPYQSEVDQTVIAGRTPYGMAVGAMNGRNLLFVTNPDSGNLTILDIDTRQFASSVHVGGKPGDVLLTPDGEYALTIDRESGDVAVIRTKTVLDRKTNEATAPMVKPVFTVFPTGAWPQSAAIVPESA
jgi:DNA-binding beta-propeller fold protein YncE